MLRGLRISSRATQRSTLKTVTFPLPQGPGLEFDLNQDVIKARPYDVTAFLNINEEGWEQRIGHFG